MNTYEPRFFLLPALVVACLLVRPAAVQSQCATDGSPNMGSPGSTIYITKYLTTPRTCSGTVSAAFACYPSLGEVVTSLTFLQASAMTGSTGVSCAWDCGPCSVSTNGANDGLPVELMDFGFEDEEAFGDSEENVGDR